MLNNNDLFIEKIKGLIKAAEVKMRRTRWDLVIDNIDDLAETISDVRTILDEIENMTQHNTNKDDEFI